MFRVLSEILAVLGSIALIGVLANYITFLFSGSDPILISDIRTVILIPIAIVCFLGSIAASLLD